MSDPMDDLIFTDASKITPAQLRFLQREKERIEEEERAAAQRVRDWKDGCEKRGSPGFVGRTGVLHVDLEEQRKWQRIVERNGVGKEWWRDYDRLLERLRIKEGAKKANSDSKGRRGRGGTSGGAMDDKTLFKGSRGYADERESSECVGVVEDDRSSRNPFPGRVIGRLKKRFTV